MNKLIDTIEWMKYNIVIWQLLLDTRLQKKLVRKLAKHFVTKSISTGKKNLPMGLFTIGYGKILANLTSVNYVKKINYANGLLLKAKHTSVKGKILCGYAFSVIVDMIMGRDIKGNRNVLIVERN